MPQSDATDQSHADVKCPELTKPQQQAALRAASEVVRAAVGKQHPALSDPTIAGAAEVPVFGCFVTIKRKGRLRGCCGFLGRRLPLAGGLLVMIAIAFAIIIGVTAGRNHFLAWLMVGFPYLVAGGLFLSSWRLSRTSA